MYIYARINNSDFQHLLEKSSSPTALCGFAASRFYSWIILGHIRYSPVPGVRLCPACKEERARREEAKRVAQAEAKKAELAQFAQSVRTYWLQERPK